MLGIQFARRTQKPAGGGVFSHGRSSPSKPTAVRLDYSGQYYEKLKEAAEAVQDPALKKSFEDLQATRETITSQLAALFEVPDVVAHYCQRTTAGGDCRLGPAGAERSWFGNAISSWAVRLYVSKRKTRQIDYVQLGKMYVAKASNKNKGIS